MVARKLLSGNSTSLPLPRPVTFNVSANLGAGAHSTSSRSSEWGVPAMKDSSYVKQISNKPLITVKHFLEIWIFFLSVHMENTQVTYSTSNVYCLLLCLYVHTWSWNLQVCGLLHIGPSRTRIKSWHKSRKLSFQNIIIIPSSTSSTFCLIFLFLLYGKMRICQQYIHLINISSQ